MAIGDPVIIEAAINGETKKEANPNVPSTPKEIASVAIGCIEAGASIVHNHIDDIKISGQAAADRYREGWNPIYDRCPEAMLYPTIVMHEDRSTRYEHLRILAEAGVTPFGGFDPGSTSFGFALQDGLPIHDFTYQNGYSEIQFALQLFSDLRVGAVMGLYDPSYVRAVMAWHRAGKLPNGSLPKFYFGGDRDFVTGEPGAVSFGLPPTPTSLEAYLGMFEETGLPWGVAVLGGDVVESGMARLALERGGHVRVGLEDYGGDDKPGNVELVEAVAKLCREVGRPIATPQQTRQILGLPQ